VSRIVAFNKSRPSLVRLRQLWGKALPSVAPDLILQRRYLDCPRLRAVEIVPTNSQNSAILVHWRTLLLSSAVRQPFNTHRVGIV
jgi:hypothetical protein